MTGPRLANAPAHLGRAGTALAALGLVAHWLSVDQQLFIVAASAVPYLLFAGLAGWCLLVAGRRWRSVAAATAVLLVGVLTQLPLYVADRVTLSGRSITVMSANLALGVGSPDAVVALVREHDVSVLTLLEQPAAEIQRLLSAGLGQLLPYRYVDTGQSRADPAFGTGVWSRYPLAGGRTLPEFSFAAVTATVTYPAEGGRPSLPVRIFAVHPAPPYPVPAIRWTRELPALARELRSVGSADPVLVGGDFNATWDNAQFRRLLRGGYRDAAEEAGAGSLRSYPVGSSVPPTIAIDHVLLRGIQAPTVLRVDVPGSDHRALIARLVLPG
ncbi:endonuclease/exonuclease/phosphatase family protein [Jatrophihabitans telluris]|uniref:Endonuclease/exonuclease/phosphatase family protein n=1 Tax=Jatrophihabitans telluris TaxID=2038343 RepID=A0ABY4QZA1_9ACTN|nr:endonuclease/exonuclease/phosphatase family protein [Jatrophihabitans telluris]UQX88341.1 endonuclease/exonuclease/phosphatase family protein [Jatrophihabitans telluris]